MSYDVRSIGSSGSIGPSEAKPLSLPVLGVQSAALRSASVGRRELAPYQPGLQQKLGFAGLLGRMARTVDQQVNVEVGLVAAHPSAGPRERGRPGGAPPFAALIEAVARRVGVEPSLLAAVAESESGFNPSAVSKAGAKGLMQLMDGTARGLGVSNAFDPQQSLVGGARFLKGLIDRYSGSLPLALAAYNAGPGAVDRHGGIPPYAETQAYVPRVLSALERYRQTAWGQGGSQLQ